MEHLYTSVNESSILAHEQLKDELFSRRPAVIAVVGDNVRLIDNLRKTEITTKHIPEVWHRLKAVAHIGLMATYAVAPLRPGLISSPSYLRDIEVVQATLINFPDEMRQVQEAILTQALAIFKNPGIVTETKQLEELIGNMKQNLRFAAQVQLDSLHAIIQKWKSLFEPEDWNKIAVVVAGGHQPRAGDITMQYFCRLAGKPLESFGSFAKLGYGSLWTPSDEDQARKSGRLLVYAENVDSFQSAIDVLKQNLLSAYLSGPLMGKIHLDFDVLAEEAFKRLHEKCTARSSHSK
jgi:hypothetical protein